MNEKFRPRGDEYLPYSAFDIAKLEKKLGFQIPDDYKEFLLAYGGCCFQGVASLELDIPNDLEIFVLYGKDANTKSCQILEDFEMHSDYLENELVPIASDLWNNRYVMNCRTGEIGFVDYSNMGEAPYIVVAPSFSAFINNIVVEPFK